MTAILRGDAKAIAQVDRFTPPSDLVAGQKLELKISHRAITRAIAEGESVETIVADLLTLWEDSGFPEFDQVTPSEHQENGTTTALELTAATAGKPFIVTARLLDENGNEVSGNEKQTVSLKNSPGGGTFTLTVTVDGVSETTAGIAYNADAATVQSALEALSILNAGDVAVTGGALPGTDVVVEFTGRLAGTNVALLTADHTGLTGGDAAVSVAETTKGVPNQNHQTQIRFRDAPSGGTFQLVVDGAITGDIAYNASAATVASAVEALPAFAAGDVSGSGGPLPGTAVTLTFGGTVAGQSFTVDLIETDLTGFSVSASVSTVQHGGPGTGVPFAYWSNETDELTDDLGVHDWTEALGDVTTATTGGLSGSGGAIQNYAVFDGNSLLRQVTGNLHPPIGSLPVEFAWTGWVWIDDTSTGPTLVYCGRDGATHDTLNNTATYGYLLHHTGAGLRFEVPLMNRLVTSTGLESALLSVATPNSVAQAQWHFCVAKARIEVDGSGDQVATASISLSADSQASASSFTAASTTQSNETGEDVDMRFAGPQPGEEWAIYVGGLDVGGYTGERAEFAGRLDELAFWNDAAGTVDAARADALFNGGDGSALDAGSNEIQDLAIAGTPSEGTLALTVTTPSGTETATVDYDEDAAGLESKLEALANVGAGNVSVSQGPLPGTDLRVEFIGDLGETNLDPMAVDDFNLQVELTTPTEGNPGTNEVQEITVSKSGDVHSGGFTLSFGSTAPTTTGTIPYTADAATIETELESLGDIDDVAVTGDDLPDGTIAVEYKGSNADTDVALLGVSSDLDSGQVEVTVSQEPLVLETITESRGPAHFDDPDNWVDLRVPDSAEDLVLEESSQDLLYGLRQRDTFVADAESDFITVDNGVDFRKNQQVQVSSDGTLPAGLSADTNYYVIDLDRRKGTFRLSTSQDGSPVDLTDAGTGTHTVRLALRSIVRAASFTGKIGLGQLDEDGEFWQYLQKALQVGLATEAGGGVQTVRIGSGNGAGSQRNRFDFGGDQWDLLVYRTGSGVNNVPALLVVGDNANNVQEIREGSVGFAFYEGEVAQLKGLNMANGRVILGRGATLTGEVRRSGGQLIAREASLNNVTFEWN